MGRDGDEWLCEVVDFHFDPATGSPFWLAAAAEFDFDPRRDVRSLDDLRLFPPFDERVLRTTDVRSLWPTGLTSRPFQVFETGGTSGRPAVRLVGVDAAVDYLGLARLLPDDAFPLGSDWLTLGPTGPHRVGEGIRHLAVERGGVRFSIDLDPRWYRDRLRSGDHRVVEAYEEHVVAQALAVLERHEHIRCLHVSSSLLAILLARCPESLARITGILCSGTPVRAEFCRLVASALPGATVLPVYGNTLMGLAPHCLSCADPGLALDYRPLSVRSHVEVVAFDDPGRIVEVGETGRVCITTMTRECFLPRLLERDEGERIGPCPHQPWGGVRNVEPARVTTVHEQLAGVY